MTWFGKPGQSAPAADSPPPVHDPPAAHDPPDRRPPAPTTGLIVPDAPPSGGDLAPLAAVELALANAEHVEEVKEIRDKAEAVRTYAERAGLGLEQQNAAAEVRLRAERRAGEMLAKMALHGGDRRGADAGDRVTLGDLGVSKDQSARWQKLARVSAGDFDAHVAAVKDRGEELTTAGLLRLAKPVRKRAAKAEPANEDAPDAGVVETLAELTDSGVKFGCLYVDPPWPDWDAPADAPTVAELSAPAGGGVGGGDRPAAPLGAGPAPVRGPGDACTPGGSSTAARSPGAARAAGTGTPGGRPTTCCCGATAGTSRRAAATRPAGWRPASPAAAASRRRCGRCWKPSPRGRGRSCSPSARRRAGPAAGWPNAGDGRRRRPAGRRRGVRPRGGRRRRARPPARTAGLGDGGVAGDDAGNLAAALRRPADGRRTLPATSPSSLAGWSTRHDSYRRMISGQPTGTCPPLPPASLPFAFHDAAD